MKFIDFFAGIGGFRRGLELAGHECVGFCEFDKFAVASYTSMHLINSERRIFLNTLDLRKRQKEILREEYRNGEWYANDIRRIYAGDIPNADCWCFGFPCQDVSVAGNQTGLSGHRSSLFFAVTRLIRNLEEESKPTYLFIENVKNLLSVNRGFDFLKILSELDEIGYDVEWDVINSAEYVPQKRERVFIIGHLRGRSGGKVFPIARDMRKIATFRGQSLGKVEQLGTKIDFGNQPRTQDRIYSARGISPALLCSGGKNGANIAIPVLTPFSSTTQDSCGIAVKVATKKGYEFAALGDSINLAVPSSKTRRGRVGKAIVNTLDTSCNYGVLVEMPEGFTVYAIWSENYQCYIAIRRLTPKECFRLQGWEDEYFERAAFVNFNNQLYKQAGNGVTVPVIRAIGGLLI